MFTGIVTNTGHLKAWEPNEAGGKMMIESHERFDNVVLGESIAINGCCLTVVQVKDKLLEFDVSDETMRKTSFQNLQPGDLVNLERAMRADDRLGGHFVLGHVDDIGKIVSIDEHGGSIEFQVTYNKQHAALLIEKGSVCVDGISLTVCDLKDEQFSVYIIPHTIENTHLKQVKVGQVVNLEFDVLGKYILRQTQVKN